MITLATMTDAALLDRYTQLVLGNGFGFKDADVAAARAEILRRMEQPRTEPCQACSGRGTWETECCNGASGCPCRGQRVDMGACHACRGTGQVEAGQQQPMANANYILENHIGYPGGGPRDGGW